MKFFIDRKFRLPRVWSNRELEKFAHLFSGDIVNVSGWQDRDKGGRLYSGYFVNKNSYTITNYRRGAIGVHVPQKEMFLDLEEPLPESLVNRFDVVFNHTVLEHVYRVHTAFRNLCLMTRDIVILVVPFLQPMHVGSDYGDYWRFTPLAIRNAFKENGMSLLYLSFNGQKKASVYIFAIASKNPSKWLSKIHNEFSYTDSRKPLNGSAPCVGCHAIPNTRYFLYRLPKRILRKLLSFLRR
ncbi:MAG: hypothetical protein ACE5JJ_05005 [Nitrospinota bacterium]